WMMAGAYNDGGSNPPPARDVRPAVEAFYEGMNRWIADGDRSLTAVLATGFVDHSLSGMPDRTASELLDDLSSLRSTTPGLRFEVLAIEAGKSIVAVDLLRSPGELASTPGWTVDLPDAQPSRELLRLDGTRVVERWAADDPWPGHAVSLAFDRAVGFNVFRQPAIQRFTLDAGSEVDLIVTETVVLLVESGELTVHMSGRDLAGSLQPPTEPIRAGGIRIFEPGDHLPVRSYDGRSVVFWTVGLDIIRVPGRAAGSLATGPVSGLEMDSLVSVPVKLPESDVRVSVSFRTVPAGTQLSADPAGMTAIAVVSGQLSGEPVSGDVSYCIDHESARLLTSVETAVAGQGFAAQSDAIASYRAIATSSVLLLSIAPSVVVRATPLFP
ncbi:MAG: hypothetical protein R2843_00075, partial [Thermomicrobiales bacterium]